MPLQSVFSSCICTHFVFKTLLPFVLLNTSVRKGHLYLYLQVFLSKCISSGGSLLVAIRLILDTVLALVSSYVNCMNWGTAFTLATTVPFCWKDRCTHSILLIKIIEKVTIVIGLCIKTNLSSVSIAHVCIALNTLIYSFMYLFIW